MQLIKAMQTLLLVARSSVQAAYLATLRATGDRSGITANRLLMNTSIKVTGPAGMLAPIGE